MSSTRSDHPLESILDKAVKDANGEEVSVGDLLDMFGTRSFGPILLVLGLLTVLPPLGAIPGLPAIVGLIIILFAGQLVFGLDHVWMPGVIETRSVSKDKIERAHEASKDWLERIDSLVTSRLTWATGPMAERISAGLVILLAAAMIPLELVPFAVAVPGLAITLIGLGLVARDGGLILAAWLVALVTGFLVYQAVG